MCESDREVIRGLRRERDALREQMEAVVMANRRLGERVAGLEGALRTIVAWQPPEVVSRIDGRKVPMGFEWGSEGVKDYFRDVAGAALAQTEPGGKGGCRCGCPAGANHLDRQRLAATIRERGEAAVKMEPPDSAIAVCKAFHELANEIEGYGDGTKEGDE